MKNKLIYALAAVAGAFSLSSCDLDEFNPTAGDATADNYKTWKGLATYCYSPLATQLYSVYDFMSVAEGGTDMWLCPSGNVDYAKQLIYYDGLTTNTNAANKVFKQAYAAIATCNSVVNNAGNLNGGTADEIRQIAAEAKTLRAFYNLILVTYYGPVTLSTQEVGDVNVNPTRNSVEEIYAAIVKDLKEAVNELSEIPTDGNYARVTKKTAYGILARAYAQGAGEGLKEDGKSYWELAKATAETVITGSAGEQNFGAYLYSDVSDLWAQANNRGNKEALFIASGANGELSDQSGYAKNNLFTYSICKPADCDDLYKTKDNANYYIGRANNCTLAPSKYSIDVSDANWDKRYENTFMTAFGEFSMESSGWYGAGEHYATKALPITRSLRTKYGVCSGDTLVPYVEMGVQKPGATNQYIPVGVWPKGYSAWKGRNAQGLDVYEPDLSKLETNHKNVYVIDYPVDVDDNRFRIVLSKEYKTAEEKKLSPYFTVNIDDFFGQDALNGYDTEYKRSPFDVTTSNPSGTNAYKLYPSLIKFNWCYSGSWGSGLNTKNGDMMIIRTAELYLIAAEAAQQLGDGATAARYLNVLRNRAVRQGKTAPQLTNATESDILDEYAREMAGELNRWALLKRHHAFETRLAQHNKRAAAFFDPAKHYNRPISADFLNQISNPDEYGDNGYGTTANKGF